MGIYSKLVGIRGKGVRNSGGSSWEISKKTPYLKKPYLKKPLIKNQWVGENPGPAQIRPGHVIPFTISLYGVRIRGRKSLFRKKNLI